MMVAACRRGWRTAGLGGGATDRRFGRIAHVGHRNTSTATSLRCASNSEASSSSSSQPERGPGKPARDGRADALNGAFNGRGDSSPSKQNTQEEGTGVLMRAEELGVVSPSGRGLIQFMGAWETLEAQLERYSMDVRPVLRSLKLLVQLLSQESEIKQEKLDNSIESALLLATLGADVYTICACLLRSAAGGNIDAIKRVEEEVGLEVAQLIHNAWRINDVSERAPELSDRVADELKRYILSFCDVRSVRIELAMQLASMRRIVNRERWEQIRVALCVLQLYVPLANALQVETIITSELLDRAFQVIFPGSFSNVASWLSKQSDEFESVLAHVQMRLQKSVKEDTQLQSMVSDVHFIGRTKSLLSTMKKLTSNGKTLSSVYDLIGVRIVVDDINGPLASGKSSAEIEALAVFGCYRVQEIVHDAFSHVNGRLKDYIASPKQNGYRSLHSTILVSRDFLSAGTDPSEADTYQPVEIQIRTRSMDLLAEHGAASHSAYKGKVTEPMHVRELQQVLQEASIAISSEPDAMDLDLEDDGETSEIDGVFSLLDLNKDGAISKKELLMLVSELDDSKGDAETVDEAVQELFAVADKNRDGKISLEEFRAFRRRLAVESAVKTLDSQIMEVEEDLVDVGLIEEGTENVRGDSVQDGSNDLLSEARAGSTFADDSSTYDDDKTCTIDDDPLNTIIAAESDDVEVEEVPFGYFSSIFKKQSKSKRNFLNPTIMRLSDFMPRMPGMPSIWGRRKIDVKTWRLLPAHINTPEDAARVASASLDPGAWQSSNGSWVATPITIKPRSAVIVGADVEEVDHVIPLPTVSGKHALLFKQGSSLYIQDLGSTNGTWVDKRRLRPGAKQKLISGCEISFDRDYAKYLVTIASPDDGAYSESGQEAPGATVPADTKAIIDRAWDGIRGSWEGLEVQGGGKKWDFEDVCNYFETEVTFLKNGVGSISDVEGTDDVLLRLGILYREWARIATSKFQNTERAQDLYKTGYSFLKCGSSIECSAEKVHTLWRWGSLRAKRKSYMIARILFMDAVSAAKSDLGDLTSYGRVGIGALHAWAEMEKNLGYADNAERLLDCAIREDPSNAYIHHSRARLAIKSRQYKLARRRFLAGVTSNPNSTMLWQSWAQLEAQRGSIEAARELFVSGMRLNPRDVVLLQSWGVAETRHGDTIRARKLFSRALSIDKYNVHVLSAWGKAEEKLGAIDEAIRLYREGIEIDPDNAHCLQALARLLSKRDEFEVATEMLDKVLARDPENAAALTERAIIEDRLGNDDAARNFAIRARKSIKRERRRRNWMGGALDAEIARLARSRTSVGDME